LSKGELLSAKLLTAILMEIHARLPIRVNW
jgi:hypothetical protein